MKKKLIIGSILAVFLLITISIVTAVGSETTTETKESPLFRIRARQAISERVGDIIWNIYANFLGESRLVFVPSLQRYIKGNELFTGASIKWATCACTCFICTKLG